MNDHIIEYLKYYIALSEAPNYSVLINGEWGSGKTYLVSRFIENENDHKFIRVSLYGVSSIADIENSFFIALHPVLGSKTARVASKLLKGILKTAIKVDLDSNGKDDVTIEYKIPDNAKWLTDLDKHIIVIDDLERSTLPINVVLGYLNELVESSGQKVIIIANEKEIEPLIEKEKETSDKNGQEEKKITKSNYSVIKEKLIGKSFTVKSDFANAFENFTFGISDAPKKMLRNNQLYISKIFVDSSYNNLRILKQTIIDFDRFYTFLPNIPEDKKELIEHIILLFFTLSFEIRKGFISGDKIQESILNMFLRDGILIKYSQYDNKSIHPISENLLANYFIYGTIDKAILSSNIKESYYYFHENTPSWQRLKDFYSLSDEKFEEYSKDAIRRLKSKDISDMKELFGCVPLLILLSYRGVIKQTVSYIIKLGKSNFYKMMKSGSLDALLENEFFESDFEFSHYDAEKYPEIGEFGQFVKNEIDNNKTRFYKKMALSIIREMNTIDIFDEALGNQNGQFPFVKTIPILQYINVRVFFNKFINFTNIEKRKLTPILKRRYGLKDYRNSLKTEQEWLMSLQMMCRKNRKSGSISQLIFRDLDSIIEVILADFMKDAKVN